MKKCIQFSFLTLSLLLSVSLSYGQPRYNAGVGSGTGGYYSVYVGPYAGRISTGHSNSFVGTEAGYSNTTGIVNTFVGTEAGYSNTSGHYNSFVGALAGKYNTTGMQNTFLGNVAGFYNTTGSLNTFLGTQAGYLNTTGYNNTFTGYRAGYATTSSNNTFIGKSAGEKNTVGGINTFVGSEAGFYNVNGYHNVFMGRSTGQNNSSGYENTFLGNSAGSVNTTGKKNVALGYLSGPSGNNLSNTIAIGHRSRVNVSDAMVLGSINGTNGATATIKVGIGTASPGYLLHANGTAAKPGGGSWTAASDKRLKQNIKDFTEGMATLEKIRPISFRYNGKAGLPTEKEYVGVIAQEMQKIAPYMIGEFTYQDSIGKEEKYLDYDATALTYILVNAAKEQGQQIQSLQQQNQILQEENAAIKQELAAIKELVLKYIPQAGNQQARLGQNNPNPYSHSTSIAYQLPATAKSAFIKVYSFTGQEVKSFDLTGKPQGEVTLSGGLLPAGNYVYTLFMDGVKIDTKKLVLTR